MVRRALAGDLSFETTYNTSIRIARHLHSLPIKQLGTHSCEGCVQLCVQSCMHVLLYGRVDCSMRFLPSVFSLPFVILFGVFVPLIFILFLFIFCPFCPLSLFLLFSSAIFRYIYTSKYIFLFSIPFMIFLLSSLPPSRNSDPGSHSRLFSLPATVRALHFIARRPAVF